MADLLLSKKDDIILANERDMELAEVDKAPREIVDRLKLDEKKIRSLADGLRQLAQDSLHLVGRTLRRTLLAKDLELQQISVPIGLLLVIFEARPDCLPQVANIT